MSAIIDPAAATRSLQPLLADARLDHVSMVVSDREAAIERLSMLVSGPFDRFEYTNTAWVYDELSTYTLHMGLARLSPTLDLEIIELKSGRNAVHERFLRERGEGLQHIAYEVRDFDAAIAAFTAAGFRTILRKDGGTPVATYIDTTAVGGFITELIRPGFRMRDPATWPR